MLHREKKSGFYFLIRYFNWCCRLVCSDEAADAQELADSLNDNYARFDAMQSLIWFYFIYIRFSALLLSDEAADAQELADTMNDMQSRYDAMLAHMEDSVSYTLDSAAVAFVLMKPQMHKN